MSILSSHNTKIEKGLKYGYLTKGIHFAPYKLSGKNVCPNASKGCAASCLNTAGMGIFSTVQEARIKKTQRFTTDKVNFMNELFKEIKAAIRKAKKSDMIPAFRLNLTSDIPWENVKVGGKSVMEIFPDVQFYDYTKNPKRMVNYLTGNFPKNYHLTFSRSESNEEHCDIILSLGGNVAMVFGGKLPETYKGKKVINGDTSDLRFLDESGVIVGLISKGDAKKDNSGFVIRL